MSDEEHLAADSHSEAPLQEKPATKKKAKAVKTPKPPKLPTHPFVHLLLMLSMAVVAAACSTQEAAELIIFLSFVLVLGYFYPLLLRWLRPRTGLLMGMILLLFLLGAAESVGIFCYEFQANRLTFPHGFLADVLMTPRIWLSVASVLVSGLTAYLLGWNMLRVFLKIFGKLDPQKPAKPAASQKLPPKLPQKHEAQEKGYQGTGDLEKELHAYLHPERAAGGPSPTAAPHQPFHAGFDASNF